MPPSPLISPLDLAALMKSGHPFMLLDARAVDASYATGHLVGAIRADVNRDLSSASEPDANPAHGGRHPLPTLARWAATLGSWGIGVDTDVVIYDELDGSNAAARAWWMLRAVGHKRVRVLEGGFTGALAEGLEVTPAPPHIVASAPYPASEWQLPSFDSHQVDSLRLDDAWRVLDVRSAVRFRGETEPIDPIAGHIPGAVNLPFSENMEGDRWKDPEKLHAQYLALLGGRPPSHLIVHCGSGVTACHTLLALHAAGLDGAGLFVGSWSEWCRNERPRA